MSFTTDMGTELGAATFMCNNLRDLFPSWVTEFEVRDDIDDCTEAADLASGCRASSSLMPNALIIPGGLHICSNLASDVSRQMNGWSAFFLKLKMLELLVSERSRRELFIDTCIDDGDLASKRCLKKFGSTLYEKRWGAVVEFVRELLPKMDVLAKYWDGSKFKAGFSERQGEAGNDADAVKRFQPEEVSVILRDPCFKLYMSMVLNIQSVLDNLSAWLEGCPCHYHLLVQRSSHLQRKNLIAEFDIGSHADCPMKGKRAPELAAGALAHTFDSICELSLTELTAAASACNGPEEETNQILSDFESARSYMKFGIEMKFGFWDQLPWKLAGLAHHRSDEARRVGREARQRFDEVVEAGGADLHHTLSMKFLLPGGPLRDALDNFVQGGNMTEELLGEVCKLRFIATVERSIEKQHSLIKKRAGKNYRTGKAVSLTLRVPNIKDQARRDPQFMDRLVTSFALMRNPLEAARRFGLSRHPAIVAASDQKFSLSQTSHVLNNIVYRCDAESKFLLKGNVRRSHLRETERQLRADVKVATACREPGVPAAAEVSRDNIVRVALLEHFRFLAEPRRVFSLSVLPSDSGELPVQKDLLGVLREPLSKRRATYAGLRSPAPQLALDIEGGEGDRVDAYADHIFFKVVHCTPSKVRTVRTSLAAGRRLVADEIAVSIHHIVDIDSGSICVDMQSVGEGSGAIKVLAGFAGYDLANLLDSFRSWATAPSLEYTIRGFASTPGATHCSTLITALVRSGAFPTSTRHHAVLNPSSEDLEGPPSPKSQPLARPTRPYPNTPGFE